MMQTKVIRKVNPKQSTDEWMHGLTDGWKKTH